MILNVAKKINACYVVYEIVIIDLVILLKNPLRMADFRAANHLLKIFCIKTHIQTVYALIRGS